jgi:hypothetical protein
MRLAGHVASIEEKNKCIQCLKGHLEDADVTGRLYETESKKQIGEVWTGYIGSE